MKSKSDPIDAYVGSRVRMRRTLLGMSQEKLGKGLDLTFQQIQKYERGTNRIGSSKLYRISRILDVPVSFFFDDIPASVTRKLKGLSDGQTLPFETNQLAKRESLELMRAYYRILDPMVRKRIFELIKSIGKVES